MNYALETFTGIRPTADLTVANYIGAIQPVLDQEASGQESAVFLAELHAITTDTPDRVAANSRELARTLIASGVQGEIYSQRQVQDIVLQAEVGLRGLTTVARLLRLPTLKEKVTHSDNTENANVALAMYPMLMAADIVLARPRTVPTGKDQKPHLEITNELIRAFNREYGARLPEPIMREVQLPNVLSLDGSGRKMSKSIPRGAIFLSDTPEDGRRKVMKAVTASEPGPAMDTAVDNLLQIVSGITDGNSQNLVDELTAIGLGVKNGDPRMKEFKSGVGETVATFLTDMSDRRSAVYDTDVVRRVKQGSEWFRVIGKETLDHMQQSMWGES